MADQDLFSTPDPVEKDFLSELVGEGKKFKDLQALAKGKYESDLTVRHLEQRLDEMRADYLAKIEESEGRARLEDLVDQLAKQSTSNDTHPRVNEDNNKKPSLDPNVIKNIVAEEIQRSKTLDKQTENFNSVMGKLKEQYGENYQTVLKERVDELDLTSDYVNDLAKRSPKAFFKTLGIGEGQRSESFQAPPQSNKRGEFSPVVTKRTWAYYQKMRKENPKLYADPKTIVQMHKDAQELGNEFADGDWDA